MRTPRWFLRLALALPILILVGVGVRTWQLEGAQLELEYQSSLRRIALSVVSRLEGWLAGDAWPGERTNDDTNARTPTDPDTRDQLLLLAAGFDREVRQRGEAAAMQWLTAQKTGAAPSVSAWLRMREASLLRRQGDDDGARELWRIIGEEDAGRDERGMRFDLSARALHLLSQPDAPDAVARANRLAKDLLADLRDEEDFAVTALADRILALHESRAEATSHRELLDATRTLRADAAWRSLQATLATSPSTARLGYTPLHGGWLLAFRPGAAVRGITRAQLQSELFGGANADLVAELGIVVEVATTAGERIAASANAPATTETQPDALVRRELPGELGSVAVSADPASSAAVNRTRRRTTWLIAIAAAILAALVAGGLGLRALRQQEQFNEQRAGFVAAVSHELKTPLTATRLLGELLERGDLDDAKVREFGGRIARESERLDQLVRNVLDLARVERLGLEKGQQAVTDVPGLWQEALERHQLAAPDSPPVVIAGATTPGIHIHADREALLGALANLLENAARHAAESPAIEVATVTRGDRVRLEVRDRGPGVPDAERARIFGEFYRGGNEDTRETRGTGIGLALVARIAKAHQGRAMCEPRDGGGSVFVIELPGAQPGATSADTPNMQREETA